VTSISSYNNSAAWRHQRRRAHCHRTAKGMANRDNASRTPSPQHRRNQHNLAKRVNAAYHLLRISWRQARISGCALAKNGGIGVAAPRFVMRWHLVAGIGGISRAYPAML